MSALWLLIFSVISLPISSSLTETFGKRSSSFTMAGGVPVVCTHIPISTVVAALNSLSAYVIDFGGDGGGRSKSLVASVVLGGSCGGTLTSLSLSTDFCSSSTLTNIGLVHSLATFLDWSRIFERSSVVNGLMF